MVVVGVTGVPGSGKSTVAQMFGERGATVLDADRIAHELMAPGRPAWREIRRAFGPAILKADGAIDRRRLADAVFEDARLRKRLEAIVHPRVLRELRRRLRELRQAGRVRVAVVEIPLLFEAGARRMVDHVIVVKADAAVRRRRLSAKGWTNQEISRRQTAQWSQAAKVALADSIVENSRARRTTRQQVERVWRNHLAAPSRRG